jgi:hypothetical protein
VGAVLANNVSSVIEESFGFIPPEVNSNVQIILKLIADAVRPTLNSPNTITTTTTQSPVPEISHLQSILAGNNNTEPAESQQVSEIESLLAYALAQQIGASIGANTSDFPVPKIGSSYNDVLSPSVQESVVVVTTEEIISPTTTTVPELFSSTFKSFDVKAVNSERASSGSAIYAPNFAPNYVDTPTTPKIPVYAPEYDHLSYTVSTSPKTTTTTTNTTVEEPETTEDDEVSTTTESLVSTTVDDDDDDDNDDENKR